MLNENQSAGDLLREWRQRRRLSQLALAVDAEISQRHLSFLESGRSQPSREMVLHLTERLSVPLRERNMILTAAGFAPIYRERPLDAPELGAARAAINQILQGHEPHPALAVDRNWTLLSANRAVGVLMAGVAEHLVAGEINVLRLSMHPEGLAGRIINFREWRAHIFTRLAHEIDVSAAPRLVALLEELKSYPTPPHALSTRVSGRPGRLRPRRRISPVHPSCRARQRQAAFRRTASPAAPYQKRSHRRGCDPAHLYSGLIRAREPAGLARRMTLIAT